MPGVPDEEADHLLQSLYACSKSLLVGNVPERVKILTDEDSQCIEIPERRREYRAHQ